MSGQMRKFTNVLEAVDEATAHKVAHILGPESAAAKALDDLERRLGAGERVGLYLSRRENAWVVGPLPPA